jgi:hypothetical protein
MAHRSLKESKIVQEVTLKTETPITVKSITITVFQRTLEGDWTYEATGYNRMMRQDTLVNVPLDVKIDLPGSPTTSASYT